MEQGRRAIDAVITLLAVPASVFLIGHATALFPETGISGWASAAAFIALVLAYATLTGPGRRSGVATFAMGAVAVAPLWLLWLRAIVNLGDDNWYIATFSGFRLGLSDRGFGHAGDIWLFLWTGSILLMVGLALAVRRVFVRSPAAPGHSEMSDTRAPTTLKNGLITFGAIYVMITAVGNLAAHLWEWNPPQGAALALFAALVGLYAFGTGPGRRTGWRAYLLLGGLLWGGLWLVIIIGYMLPLSYDAFNVYEALIAGLIVKVEVTDSSTPFGTSEILRMLEIVAAVVAGPALRELGRKAADKRV